VQRDFGSLGKMNGSFVGGQSWFSTQQRMFFSQSFPILSNSNLLCGLHGAQLYPPPTEPNCRKSTRLNSLCLLIGMCEGRDIVLKLCVGRAKRVSLKVEIGESLQHPLLHLCHSKISSNTVQSLEVHFNFTPTSSPHHRRTPSTTLQLAYLTHVPPSNTVDPLRSPQKGNALVPCVFLARGGCVPRFKRSAHIYCTSAALPHMHNGLYPREFSRCCFSNNRGNSCRVGALYPCLFCECRGQIRRDERAL
jgi:hypothetical protein